MFLFKLHTWVRFCVLIRIKIKAQSNFLSLFQFLYLARITKLTILFSGYFHHINFEFYSQWRKRKLVLHPVCYTGLRGGAMHFRILQHFLQF